MDSPHAVSVLVLSSNRRCSIQFLPVSMFTIFKNITIIIIAIGERSMFNSKITPLMFVSFACMIVSSLVGGLNDIMFSLRGYMWMGLNCLTSAGYVLFMRHRIRVVQFKDLDSVNYNHVLGLPILVVGSVVFDDWGSFASEYLGNGSLVHQRTHLLIAIAFSSISAFAISYATSWCLRVSTSTTYSMVGSLNKLPVAVSGMLFIPAEKNVSSGSVISILLGIVSVGATVRVAS